MTLVAHPTLYKKTSTGATQLWFAETSGGMFRTTSGQIDGKKTTSKWTEVTVKNSGKANATTIEEQAVLEVEALYRKKLAESYHSSLDTIATPVIYQVMLAEKYSDRKEELLKSKEYYFAQPKVDGLRCIAKADGLWSRRGKPFVNCPHIIKALAPIFEKYPHAVFDGELYNHDLKNDFNTLASNIKKSKPTPETWKESERTIQYHIYDMPSVEGKFLRRNEELYEILYSEFKNDYLKYLETFTIGMFNQEKIDELYARVMEEGYEGLMIRENSTYEHKRTKKLLKYKEFITEEFVLTDLVEGKGNWSGMAKSAEFIMDSGETFSAGIRGNQQFTRELLENRRYYIGKLCTVRYLNLTPAGKPRHGIVVEFDREDV